MPLSDRLSGDALRSLPLLERCSQIIGTLYDLTTQLSLPNLLVEAEHVSAMGLTVGPGPEEVLVVQERDGEALGLYLNPATLKALSIAQASGRYDWEALLPAIEGVSHVQWLSWRKQHAMPITALELEVHGELDKFFVVLVLSCQRPEELQARAKMLRRRLFSHWHVAPEAHQPHLQERYRVASRCAAGIIDRVLASTEYRLPRQHWVKEMRRVTRLGWPDKFYLGR